MPALTMRGRYLMREYWADSELHTRLTAEERELLWGLWMLADDGGWLPRNVTEIAASVYQFEDRAPREAKVRSGLRRLADIGKVKSHRCGHLEVPSVRAYPRAGKKSTEHEAAHAQCARRIQKDLKSEDSNPNDHSNGFEPIQTDLNPSPVPSSPVLTSPDVAHPRARSGAAGGEPIDILRLRDEEDAKLRGRRLGVVS